MDRAMLGKSLRSPDKLTSTRQKFIAKETEQYSTQV